jgi:hypothetical protein
LEANVSKKNRIPVDMTKVVTKRGKVLDGKKKRRLLEKRLRRHEKRVKASKTKVPEKVIAA